MVIRSYTKAITVYTKLIKGIQDHDGNRTPHKLMKTIPHVLLIKYNLAECYRNLNRFDQTDELFSEVLFKYSLHNDEHLENYTILLSIAEYFIGRQRMDYALEALIKIAEVNKVQEIERNDPELFTLIYDEIASILFNRQEFLEAAKYYELGLKLKTKFYGIKHPKVGFSFLALGYRKGKEPAKAFQKLSSGVDVIEAIEGRNNLYSANTCNMMAKIKFELGDYSKAMHFYERSLEIYTQLYGMTHSYCLRVYINLIHLCFVCQNMAKLGQIIERTMKAVDETTNPESFAVLNEVANIYRKNGCSEQAILLYQKAIKKFAEIDKGEIDPEVIYLVYCNLASSYLHTRKYGDALHYYLSAGNYFDKIDRGVNKGAAQVAINVARVYKLLGKAETAVFLKKAEDICKGLEKQQIDTSGLRTDIRTLTRL